MTNLSLITDVSYVNSKLYRQVECGIYKDLNDNIGFSEFRMIVAVKIDNSTSKTFLEQIFEDALVYIEDTIEYTSNEVKYILGGDLEDIKIFKTIINNFN